MFVHAKASSHSQSSLQDKLVKMYGQNYSYSPPMQSMEHLKSATGCSFNSAFLIFLGACSKQSSADVCTVWIELFVQDQAQWMVLASKNTSHLWVKTGTEMIWPMHER